MLYITTKRGCETYTAARTLTADTAPNCGLFVPFQMPQLSVNDLQSMDFSQRIVYILGNFFRTKLTVADVERCLGQKIINMRSIDRKVTVIEGWNRTNKEFSKMEYALYSALCCDVTPCKNTTKWPKIAIRTAIFAAAIAEIYEGREVDIAVNTGDFLAPISAYYCKKMGIPVGTVVCGLNENGGLWDFFTHGQLNCGAAVTQTALPQMDVSNPVLLQQLLFDKLGLDAAEDFASTLKNRKIYALDRADLEQVSKDFTACVVGSKRVPSLIHRIYMTNNYVLDTYSALTFGALQDHRASSGEIRQTLLFSEYSPMVHRADVAGALNIPEFKLSELL